MKLIEVQIENFRCIQNLIWKLNPKINVLAGENDAGKTAIVDAIHLTLGSVAQDSNSYVTFDDFRRGSEEIRITCKFDELDSDINRFIEHLTYEGEKEKIPYLYISLQAELTGNERWPISTRFVSGKPIAEKTPKAGKTLNSSNGNQIEFELRDYLKTTYLRPLRDAEHELRSRRGSRLSLLISRLVSNTSKEDLLLAAIRNFEKELRAGFSEYTESSDDPANNGVILKQLLEMLFEEEKDKTSISLSLASEQKLKNLLERLDLGYSDGSSLINRGLGYNNLLFIAAELSLFNSGFRLLIIEEPEAHLHPQLQLKLAKHLNNLSDAQIILTTHSPNLASNFNLDSITIVKKGEIFPLDSDSTELSGDDRLFLECFLDVTKANLFFAKGIILVEGEAEELLIPTLSALLGCDLIDNGISIINVGSKAAARYAKIYLRKDNKNLEIPVAILTDQDQIPDSMKLIHPEYCKKDAGTINSINSGSVKTFVSDCWTLEYDLAFGDGNGNNLACEILQALFRLQNENNSNGSIDYLQKGKELYEEMVNYYGKDYSKVASQIMYIFENVNTTKGIFTNLTRKAKPEMALSLAAILNETKPKDLNLKIPKYILESMNYMCHKN